MKKQISLIRLISNFLVGLILLITCFLQTTLPVSAESYIWVETGSMINPMPFHTSTVLLDGRVLVAGGNDGSANLTSAELYDPNSGTWTTSGSMKVARRQHQAIRLPNGDVLVAGGNNDSYSISSAELYKPSTGTWAFTGSMNVGRYGFAAILLPNGKVLVAGGWDYVGNSGIKSAELYDPTTGTWSFTGSMNTARNATVAILLSNGKVLITAGEDSAGHFLQSAELYDPTAGTWAYTGPMNTVHGFFNPTVLLSDGKVLVTGSPDNATCEIYNPDTNAWTTTGSMNVIRRAHFAVRLPDGKILAAGGTPAGVGGWTDSAEIYDPVHGTWTSISHMNFAHFGPTASILSDGNILVTGSNNSIGGAELFIINHHPISNAGPNQSVYTLSQVTLDGSASSDPDGDIPLTYFWTQIAGIPVHLSDPAVVNPTFIASSLPGTLTFSLTVTDSRGCPDPIGDEVNIMIKNQAPVSNAGPDQVVKTLTTVTLDGSASFDPDHDLPLNYLWIQTSGIAVILSDPTIDNPTFTAPSESSILKFSLVAADSLGLMDPTPDEVVINVQGYHLFLPSIVR